MNTAILFACVLVALVDARAFAVSMRGPYAAQYPLGRTVIGFLSLIATFALLIWGFTHLSWYWTVGALVVGVILQAILVTRSTLAPLISIAVVLQVIVIAGAVYLWGAAR